MKKILDDLRHFTLESKSKVSDFDWDFELLKLRCYETNDFSLWIDALESVVARGDASLIPHDFQRVQLVGLKCRLTQDAAIADRLLQSVTLTGKDFPWLADILLAHKARAARLRGDHASEQHACTALFQRQPLLFEPSHVMNFGLFEYQEVLKQDYRNMKQPRA
jgi:hypothetical protein